MLGVLMYIQEILYRFFIYTIATGGVLFLIIIGCEDGVNYYDSMYPSASSATMQLIASLVFSSASELEVRTMDVGQQPNGSDCGVLAIAFAF